MTISRFIVWASEHNTTASIQKSIHRLWFNSLYFINWFHFRKKKQISSCLADKIQEKDKMEKPVYLQSVALQLHPYKFLRGMHLSNGWIQVDWNFEKMCWIGNKSCGLEMLLCFLILCFFRKFKSWSELPLNPRTKVKTFQLLVQSFETYLSNAPTHGSVSTLNLEFGFLKSWFQLHSMNVYVIILRSANN